MCLKESPFDAQNGNHHLGFGLAKLRARLSPPTYLFYFFFESILVEHTVNVHTHRIQLWACVCVFVCFRRFAKLFQFLFPRENTILIFHLLINNSGHIMKHQYSWTFGNFLFVTCSYNAFNIRTFAVYEHKDSRKSKKKSRKIQQLFFLLLYSMIYLIIQT